MKYEIQVSQKAEDELGSLPAKVQRQIIEKLRLLKDNPRHNSEKLSGHSGFRMRSGNYRILFEVEDETQTVVVFAIKDRKDAYRGL